MSKNIPGHVKYNFENLAKKVRTKTWRHFQLCPDMLQEIYKVFKKTSKSVHRACGIEFWKPAKKFRQEAEYFGNRRNLKKTHWSAGHVKCIFDITVLKNLQKCHISAEGSQALEKIFCSKIFVEKLCWASILQCWKSHRKGFNKTFWTVARFFAGFLQAFQMENTSKMFVDLVQCSFENRYKKFDKKTRINLVFLRKFEKMYESPKYENPQYLLCGS